MYLWFARWVSGTLQNTLQSVEMLHTELQKETKIKKNLVKENQKIYEELLEEIKQKKIREDQILTETESLKKFIKKLETKNGTDKNAKELSTLSPTTKWRYLKDLKTKAQKALRFLRAYGPQTEQFGG